MYVREMRHLNRDLSLLYVCMFFQKVYDKSVLLHGIEIIVYTQREQTCQGFANTRSFDMSLTSGEVLKLECFK